MQRVQNCQDLDFQLTIIGEIFLLKIRSLAIKILKFTLTISFFLQSNFTNDHETKILQSVKLHNKWDLAQI